MCTMITHVVQSVISLSDAFASVLSFQEVERLRMVNRDFKSTSTLHLWQARAKFLRLLSFEGDYSTFHSVLSSPTLMAELAYKELSNCMKVSIQFGKVEHVRTLLQGVMEAESVKPPLQPFLKDLVTIVDPQDSVQETFASWLFFAISRCQYEDENAMILPMLLNVEEQDHLRELLLCKDFSHAGGNCIMLCAQFGKLKFLQILLESARKANLLHVVLMAVDSRKENCLYCAIKHKRLEVVVEVLDAAESLFLVEDILYRITDDGQSCFSEAVLSGEVNIVRAILEHAQFADILHQLLMERTVNNKSCLHLAIHKYNPEVFMALLEAAREAERGGSVEVMEAMLSAQTFDGRHPLFDAVASVNVDAVRAILEAARSVSSSPEFLHDLLVTAPFPERPFAGMSCLHYLITSASEISEMGDGFADSWGAIFMQLQEAATQADAHSRLAEMVDAVMASTGGI